MSRHSSESGIGWLAVGLLAAAFGGCAPAEESVPVERAVEAEAGTAEEGWITLFDGSDLDAFRGYRMEALPAGWDILDGALHFAPPTEGERADLVTRETFADFELEFEWAVSPAGNSGVMFRVSEDLDRSYQTGAEYQVLDDSGHRDGENPITSAASNYALHPRSAGVTKALGEFNAARLVVDGDRVEHWLNGEKVVEYTLWDADWEARVAASKFAAWERYGRNSEGLIAIQDHGDEVWFRNLRVRRLD